MIFFFSKFSDIFYHTVYSVKYKNLRCVLSWLNLSCLYTHAPFIVQAWKRRTNHQYWSLFNSGEIISMLWGYHTYLHSVIDPEVFWKWLSTVIAYHSNRDKLFAFIFFESHSHLTQVSVVDKDTIEYAMAFWQPHGKSILLMNYREALGACNMKCFHWHHSECIDR